jgi:hypothetical protein
MQILDTGVMGTRSAVLRLTRRGSDLTFVVFPMIHVASPGFYAEVQRRLAGCAVVVMEGVSGRSAIGSAITASYRVIPANRKSGLVEQDFDLDALDAEIINPDVTGEEFDESWRKLPLGVRVMMWCAIPVVTVMQLFGGRKRLLAPDVALDDDELPESEMEEQLDGVFIDERNDRLLAALFDLHETRGHERIDVAVVYGAGHVPDLVHRLAQTLGYRPRTAEWITAVDW